ncbi:hypothetical protein D3C81_1800360 [compost metagenome]
MTEPHILQRHAAVEMLEAFFQINVVFGAIRLRLIDHILLDLVIDAANCIHQLNKALKVGIDIVLNRDAKQFADGLHRGIGPVGYRCIDAFFAMLRDRNIGIT